MEQTPECQSKSDNDEELYFDGTDLVVGGQSESESIKSTKTKIRFCEMTFKMSELRA